MPKTFCSHVLPESKLTEKHFLKEKNKRAAQESRNRQRHRNEQKETEFQNMEKENTKLKIKLEEFNTLIRICKNAIYNQDFSTPSSSFLSEAELNQDPTTDTQTAVETSSTMYNQPIKNEFIIPNELIFEKFKFSSEVQSLCTNQPALNLAQMDQNNFNFENGLTIMSNGFQQSAQSLDSPIDSSFENDLIGFDFTYGSQIQAFNENSIYIETDINNEMVSEGVSQVEANEEEIPQNDGFLFYDWESLANEAEATGPLTVVEQDVSSSSQSNHCFNILTRGLSSIILNEDDIEVLVSIPNDVYQDIMMLS